MTNHSNTSRITSARIPQWVACIATADFAGDALCTQLSFRKNDRVEIDLRQPPHNGWRWGKTVSGKGWFPDWAVIPLPSRTRPSSTEHRHQTPISFHKHNNNNNNNNNNNHHHHLGRSRDRVAPLAYISENPMNNVRMIQRPLQGKHNDFDLRSNAIMGGQHLSTASSSNHLDRQRKTRLGNDENNHVGANQTKDWLGNDTHWKEQFTKMLKTENPYTKDQKEPEWDGSEVPQIVNNVNGRVTVLGTDGKASSYRNERSYKLADATNRMVEKLSSAGKTLEKKASGIRMPVLYKPTRSDTNSGSGRGSSNGGGKETKKSGTATATATKKELKVPKMPSFSKTKLMGNMKFRQQ